MTEPPRRAWLRSSHSTSGEHCVEVTLISTDIGVRDSEDPDGPGLAFAPLSWRRFVQQVKAGGHDRL